MVRGLKSRETMIFSAQKSNDLSGMIILYTFLRLATNDDELPCGLLYMSNK